MTFELMELPYQLDALEPHLSKQELQLHHGKHHAGYVKKLNELVKGTEFKDKDLQYIIKNADSGPIFNNAAQIFNHDLYWKSMSLESKFDEKSKFGSALIKEYKSLDEFLKKFKDAATKLFGSGWIYIIEQNGKIEIVQEKNAMNPIAKTDGGKVLFNCDVWEHAYTYQEQYFADRPAYIDGFVKLINWDFVEEQYTKK